MQRLHGSLVHIWISVHFALPPISEVIRLNVTASWNKKTWVQSLQFILINYASFFYRVGVNNSHLLKRTPNSDSTSAWTTDWKRKHVVQSRTEGWLHESKMKPDTFGLLGRFSYHQIVAIARWLLPPSISTYLFRASHNTFLPFAWMNLVTSEYWLSITNKFSLADYIHQ